MSCLDFVKTTLITVLGSVVAIFVNYFVIVCNMFQKMFKDCLD